MRSVRSEALKTRFIDSVANLGSGHCRRRKIRCVLALDDPTARCSNCIRLKKDCHFYPVDQQPPFAKPTRSGSKADIGINDPETSISSSSPGMSGNLVEQMDEFPGGQDALSMSQDGQYSGGMAASDRGTIVWGVFRYKSLTQLRHPV